MLNRFRERWRRFVPFASPGFLAVALVFALLPWVEIRCNSPAEGSPVLMRQSGVQAVYGGCSETPSIKAAAKREQKGLSKTGSERKRPEPHLEQEKDVPIAWAPVVLVALLLFLTGTLLGFALQPGRVRTRLVAICAMLGLLLLIGQAVAGFPIEDALAESLAQARRMDGETAAAVSLAIDVRYTGWFWGTLALACLAAMPAVAEQLVAQRAAVGNPAPRAVPVSAAARPMPPSTVWPSAEDHYHAQNSAMQPIVQLPPYVRRRLWWLRFWKLAGVGAFLLLGLAGATALVAVMRSGRPDTAPARPGAAVPSSRVEHKIVGKWQGTEDSRSFEFCADGTANEVVGWSTFTGTYTIKESDRLTVRFDNVPHNYQFKFASDNELTLIGPGGRVLTYRRVQALKP